jgi:hypothetical protein
VSWLIDLRSLDSRTDISPLSVIHGKVVKVNIAKAMKVEANPNRAGMLFTRFSRVMILTFWGQFGSRKSGSKSTPNLWMRAEDVAFRPLRVQMPWRNKELRRMPF